MAYLKPQSPLTYQDDYIYPLTTADQVIMPDGSRFTGVTITPDDIASATLGTWNGLSTPNEIPIGMTRAEAGADGAETGFPADYVTCITVKVSVHRCFQIAVEKANGVLWVRSSNDGTTWGDAGWQKYTNKNATTSASGLMSSTDKTKLDSTNVAYGTCSTAAATAAKVITISGNTNWELTTGSMIAVKFSTTNTAQNPTFNVNGTGAKSVWANTAVITTSYLTYAGSANRVANYVYDGTQYVFIGWSNDANTTYTNLSLGQGYGTCATAAATAAKVVTMSSYALTTGGIVVVKFTYAVPASATMNINSKGAKNIYYKGAAITANIIKAGDTATFIYDGTRYHLLAVDRSAFDTVLNGTFTASGWSSSAPYTQTITVTGITADDYPDADINMSSATATTGPQLVEGWSCINRIATAANKVTAYCYSEKPTINLPAYFKVVR